MDETPVHADVEPPAFSTSIDGREGNGAGTTELPTSSASLTATDGSKGPKWMQNDRKVAPLPASLPLCSSQADALILRLSLKCTTKHIQDIASSRWMGVHAERDFDSGIESTY